MCNWSIDSQQSENDHQSLKLIYFPLMSDRRSRKLSKWEPTSIWHCCLKLIWCPSVFFMWFKVNRVCSKKFQIQSRLNWFIQFQSCGKGKTSDATFSWGLWIWGRMWLNKRYFKQKTSETLRGKSHRQSSLKCVGGCAVSVGPSEEV